MRSDTRTVLLYRSKSTLESSDERIRRAQQLIEDSRLMIRHGRAPEMWAPRVPADVVMSPLQQVHEIIQRNSCLVEISRQLIDIARALVHSNRERMGEVTRAIPRLPAPREP